MFNKLYSELTNINEMKCLLSHIDSILDYVNKDGIQTGILEAVIEILQHQIEKEKPAKEAQDISKT